MRQTQTRSLNRPAVPKKTVGRKVNRATKVLPTVLPRRAFLANTGVKSPANAMLECSASDRGRAFDRIRRLTTWFSPRGSLDLLSY